jgi:hypothetical protein
VGGIAVLERKRQLDDMLQRSGQARAPRARGITTALVLTAALLMAGAAGAQPAVQSALTVTGCCVCRGTVSGQPNTSLSCEDGLTVKECTQKCQSAQASSLVFGKTQSCADGCAGLSTGQLPE